LADVCFDSEVREACKRGLDKNRRRKYVAKKEVLERDVQVEDI